MPDPRAESDIHPLLNPSQVRIPKKGRERALNTSCKCLLVSQRPAGIIACDDAYTQSKVFESPEALGIGKIHVEGIGADMPQRVIDRVDSLKAHIRKRVYEGKGFQLWEVGYAQ